MAMDGIDWTEAHRALDEQGWARLPRLVRPQACRELRALWDDEARFRSRVVMARHGFGEGEYRYFAYPLPDPVGGSARSPLSAARRDRQPLAVGAGPGAALSRRAFGLSRPVPGRRPGPADAAAAALRTGRL